MVSLLIPPGSARNISFADGKWPRGRNWRLLIGADWTPMAAGLWKESSPLGSNLLLKISHLCAPAIQSLMRA